MSSMFGKVVAGLRAVDYRRVSSEEQATGGFSLSAQSGANRRFIEESKGWIYAGSYEDPGRSGKTIYRPAFQQMLEDAKAGAFDVIVVHKIDRFSRSLTDFLLVLRQLKECNVRFVSVTEDIDFTTPIGELILVVLAWLAQWYLENLRAETSKGKRERARKGHWNGTLPFGYTTPARLKKRLNDLGEEYRAGRIAESDYAQQVREIEDVLEHYSHAIESQAVPDPLNATAVRFAFEQYATGQVSDMEVAATLNNAGYRTTGQYGSNLFSKEAVRLVLTNTFYIGRTKYKGEVYDGVQPPLVDVALFQRVQEARRRRAPNDGYWRRANRIGQYPLGGLLYCAECQQRWVGHLRRGQRRYRDGGRDHGHACTIRPASVEAEQLEAQVIDFIGGIRMPDADILQGMEPQSTHDATQQRRVSLERRVGRLRRLFELGDIDEHEYTSRRTRLQRDLANLPDTSKEVRTSFDGILAVLHDLPALWQSAAESEQQEWLQLLFTKIWVDQGSVVAAQATSLLWDLCTLSETTYPPEGEGGYAMRRRPDLSPHCVPIRLLSPSETFTRAAS